jgi:PPK2 family polyphosphate:nucleotide phosphotransferase
MHLDSPYRITSGRKFRVGDVKTDDTGHFKDKHEALIEVKKDLKKLAAFQELLYAQAKHAVLVVLQAMDTGGKDGAISHVFSGVNPQGCSVTSFKVPTELETSHDFLWRIHAAVPRRGTIGIFNRSHYESVLVERVHQLVPRHVWRDRYDQINAFEQMLTEEGVTILKFFLHISKDEQKRRLQARLDDREKHWKFSANDLKERKFWDDYQEAYEEAIGRCSTKAAPWFVVPADHKWYRNWVLSDIITRALRGLHMKYPEAAKGLDTVVIK